MEPEEQQGRGGVRHLGHRADKSSVFIFDGSLKSLNSDFERRHMFGDHGPNDVISDLVVLMTQNIADSANLFPRYVRRKLQQVIG
jgi:hypothetical protein